jgi:coenzyme F420-reducing hydrogenase delta subunit
MAGVSRLQYANEIRLIRVMCSGRVDLAFILRALANGLDGVFIGGCRLDECNYITHGNYDALSNVYLCRQLMQHIGLNPERLRIAFMSGGDGILLTEVVNEFVGHVKALGPIGQSEGVGAEQLALDLAALCKLVPYLKLVERVKSEQAYHAFFNSDAVSRLLDTLITDQLAVSRILTLLRANPLPTGDIAAALGLNPSDVARHMNRSARMGYVKYDIDTRSYALA